MNIFIDFDDTITMSVENVVRIVNKRFGKNVKAEDIKEWDFSDVYPDIPLKDIVDIFGEDEFFQTLRLKKDVLPTLRDYRNRAQRRIRNGDLQGCGGALQGNRYR